MTEILSLPITKEWFEMILNLEKKEEYREIKPYWSSRLKNKKIKYLKLINGYGNKRPYIIIELKNIKISEGKENWGAIPKKLYYVLELGEIKKISKGEK